MQEQKLGFPSWPRQAPPSSIFSRLVHSSPQSGTGVAAYWPGIDTWKELLKHLTCSPYILYWKQPGLKDKTPPDSSTHPQEQVDEGQSAWGLLQRPSDFPHVQPTMGLSQYLNCTFSLWQPPLIPPVWSQQTEGFCDPRSPSKSPRWWLQPTGLCTHPVVLAVCLVTGGRTPRKNECGVMLLIKNSPLDLCTFDSIYATCHWCSHLYGLLSIRSSLYFPPVCILAWASVTCNCLKQGLGTVGQLVWLRRAAFKILPQPGHLLPIMIQPWLSQNLWLELQWNHSTSISGHASLSARSCSAAVSINFVRKINYRAHLGGL